MDSTLILKALIHQKEQEKLSRSLLYFHSFRKNRLFKKKIQGLGTWMSIVDGACNECLIKEFKKYFKDFLEAVLKINFH